MISRLYVVAILLCTMWINQGFAQHDTLLVRIDTITVKFGTIDTLIPIHYRLLDSKPALFRGYDSYLDFDASKVSDSLPIPSWVIDSVGHVDPIGYNQYVDTALDRLMFVGTASKDISLRVPRALRGEIRAIVEGGSDQFIDTSKSILYRIYMRFPKIFSDTVFDTIRQFDQTSAAPFDAVIVQPGWIKYQRTPLSVTTAKVGGQADSLIVVLVTVSDITETNIRTAEFSFSFDTTVLRFMKSIPGRLSGDSIATADVSSGEHVSVFISNLDSNKAMAGSGTMMWLLFRAIDRRDTVCTVLKDTVFSPVNADALVSTATLTVGEICVEGEAASGVISMQNAESSALDVWPNPFQTELNIGVRSEIAKANVLYIYDGIGRLMLNRTVARGFVWKPSASLPEGMYLIRVTGEPLAGMKPESFERHVVLIH